MCVICYNSYISQWGSQKLLQGLVSYEITASLSVFNLHQNDVNQINFEPQNSLRVSFINIWVFAPILLNLISLESNSPGISWFMWEKLRWINWFWQFLCEGLSSFNLKRFYYSYAWSCSLCERRTSFCTGLISRKLCRFLFMFSTGFTSLSVLLLFPLSIAVFLFIHLFLIIFHLK